MGTLANHSTDAPFKAGNGYAVLSIIGMGWGACGMQIFQFFKIS